MSYAWEITPDDVATVLDQHGVDSCGLDALCDGLDHDAIVRDVLRYTTFEDQCEAAMDAIENALIAQGIIGGPKVYHAPQSDQDKLAALQRRAEEFCHWRGHRWHGRCFE